MPWLHVVLDVPATSLAEAGRFWAAALGWPLGRPWRGHRELRSFEPPQGRAYVHLQQIDAAARVHIDVEADDIDAVARRAVGHGATAVARTDRWTVLRSPGGLPFCVGPRGERLPPEPVSWPDGHRTRLVQVCIDSPASGHDREVRFWRQLLPGRWASSDSPEFSGKWHDAEGSPVQLLFQRLDEPEGPTRAHLDLGTDDLEAEVDRLLDLGATDLGAGHGGWHVLRDPGGTVFCVTLNSPSQARERDLG